MQNPDDATRLRVEVAYARPDEQSIFSLEVPPETTIEQTIRQSGILEHYQEICLENQDVGVFGKLKRLSDTLRNGDRVEIYRPLKADPKQSRRKRASRG